MNRLVLFIIACSLCICFPTTTAQCPFASMISTACLQGLGSYSGNFPSDNPCKCLQFINSDRCASLMPTTIAHQAALCAAAGAQVVGPSVNMSRLTPPDYGDGVSTPAGSNRPSARLISNIVSSDTVSHPDALNATDWVWLFGQFLTHDLDLTTTNAAEPFPIPVPKCDPQFDPDCKGTQTLQFTRSNHFPGTGTSTSNPRQQIGLVTPLIDLSQVYGSLAARTTCLRINDGSGGLLYSAGDILPYDTLGLPLGQNPDGTPLSGQFLTGDIRTNEHVALVAVHNLFMREHNRIAAAVKAQNPSWTDDQIFDLARQVAVAEWQLIVYEEYLPLMIGSNALPAYTGFKSSTSPIVSMEFAQAAFRLHTMISNSTLLVDNAGTVLLQHPMSMSFFNTQFIQTYGIGNILKGLASQICQENDVYMVDGLRNLLFNATAGGSDLFAVDVQRGRDHGLQSYAALRAALGLSPKSTFSSISSDPAIVQKLAQAYNSVDDIDVLVGMLAEDHVGGSMVGELQRSVLVDQFTRARDADPAFYLLPAQMNLIEQYGFHRLSEIIKANTDISNLQQNVFVLPSV